MAFVFELPEVGEGVVEAEVVSWSVAVGDQVAVDQPLCEITTDKAQLEISSPRAGKVLVLHGNPGDIIKVHSPLVELDTDDASEPAPAPAPPQPDAPQPRAAAPVDAPAPPLPAGPSTTRATPAVRRAARELGVDIDAVRGTGPGGRVTRDDLVAAPPVEAPELPLPRAPIALPQVQPSGTEQRIKIVGIRRKIAEAMVRSIHTAAHFTYVEEVDCTELVKLRTRAKPLAAARGIKLTYIPFMMKAASVAMRDFPNVNAVMDEERFELVVKGSHDFGLSTDTRTGLIVPVIRSVEQKSILQIAAELQDLIERTRAGRARADELRGSTFTLTSVGSIGGVLATPILNVPEVAILGVNAIRDAAVVRDGEIVIRKMMFLSPSFDHRVIDGAVGARFVARLKELIENPEALLVELS